MSTAESTADDNKFKLEPESSVPCPGKGRFDALVLGSCVSTACPVMGHVLRRQCEHSRTARRKCDGLTVCEEAYSNINSKNRRNNVSILVRYTPPDGNTHHIMVDAGKTLREAVLKSFPKFNVTCINTLLVTHGHADAMLGLDDIRDLQIFTRVLDKNGEVTGYRVEGGALAVLSNKATLDTIRQSFPYIAAKPDMIEPGVLKRRVAYVELTDVENNASIDVAGLPVRFFPVLHGGTYISLGFAFGRKAGTCAGEEGHPFIYISDVKHVPDDVMDWLSGVARIGIDLLVVDTLMRDLMFAHFNLDEALALIRKLRPKRALLVGMNSCSIGDHDEVNHELQALREPCDGLEGIDVQLAYDGQYLQEFDANVP